MSIKSEKITVCELFNRIFDKSFVGKKPPDEMIVIERFNELNTLIFNKFKITKIMNVINEYLVQNSVTSIATAVAGSLLLIVGTQFLLNSGLDSRLRRIERSLMK